MELRPDLDTEFDIACGNSPDECASNDRRRHGRSMRVMRVARLANEQAEGLGMVRDVSSGGMKIDAYFPLEIGQTVSIALLDDHELTGTVSWKDGQSVGIEFAQATPVDDILAKPSLKADGLRTRLPRFAIDRAVTLEHDKSKLPSTICDISQRGVKMTCSAKIPVHSNIMIRAAERRPVMATVKWRGGDYLGAEFHRLMPIEELVTWMESDQPEAS